MKNYRFFRQLGVGVLINKQFSGSKAFGKLDFEVLNFNFLAFGVLNLGFLAFEALNFGKITFGVLVSIFPR